MYPFRTNRVEIRKMSTPDLSQFIFAARTKNSTRNLIPSTTYQRLIFTPVLPNVSLTHTVDEENHIRRRLVQNHPAGTGTGTGSGHICWWFLTAPMALVGLNL